MQTMIRRSKAGRPPGRKDPRRNLPDPPPPSLAEYVAFARRLAGAVQVSPARRPAALEELIEFARAYAGAASKGERSTERGSATR